MPFRAQFDCLWCGQHWVVRSDADLEGWAMLCPECLGRADDNGFLRLRLRTALQERSRATGPTAVDEATPRAGRTVDAPTTSASTPVAGEGRTQAGAAAATPPGANATARRYDDWYLRRGDFARGPIVDQPWLMELDEVTRWVDGAPMSGRIVELGAGAGWWSTLLAGKGELWTFEADDAAVERARQRLVSHGLLAHLHVRDPLAPPEGAADVVFAAYLLGASADASGLRQRLELVRRWLRPEGAFVFIEAGRGRTASSRATSTGTDEGADAGRIEGPTGPLRLFDPARLREDLAATGLEPLEMSATGSAFLMGRAAATP